MSNAVKSLSNNIIINITNIKDINAEDINIKNAKIKTIFIRVAYT